MNHMTIPLQTVQNRLILQKQIYDTSLACQKERDSLKGETEMISNVKHDEICAHILGNCLDLINALIQFNEREEPTS